MRTSIAAVAVAEAVVQPVDALARARELRAGRREARRAAMRRLVRRVEGEPGAVRVRRPAAT